MAGSRVPGPNRLDTLLNSIRDGTSALIKSPTPGILGKFFVRNGVASAVFGATGKSDPAIEALDLSATAKKAAYKLKVEHPEVVFTSGRRNKADQARAMAGNVVKNRQWIKATYVQSKARDDCQKWVDAHPDKKTKDEISEGLLAILNSLTDAEVSKLSKHLSGDAFDVQPVVKNAQKIKQTIRNLPGLHRFLDKEGGLIRWHAQFH